MTDYTELIKQLKTYEDGYGLYDAAAAAIEALQAEQKKTVTQIFCEEQMAWEGRCKDLMKYISDLQAEVDTLKRVDYKRCQECLYLGQPVGEQFIPKHGEWVIKGQDIFCSVCGEESACNSWGASKFSNYCPNCGAKMEVQDEDN